MVAADAAYTPQELGAVNLLFAGGLIACVAWVARKLRLNIEYAHAHDALFATTNPVTVVLHHHATTPF